MAKKISQLPTAGALDATETLAGVQAGATKKFPVTLFTSTADLAATASGKGAALIGWLRSAASAVATTVAARLGWFEPCVFEFLSAAAVLNVQTGAATVDTRAAIAAADTAGPFVFYKGTYKVSSNITISNDVEFKSGAKLSIDTGVVVTFSGKVSANTQTIFTGLGSVSLSARSQRVQSEWWGASTSATGTANSAAINAAITAAVTARGTVILPSGSLNVDGLITQKKGVSVRGALNNAAFPEIGEVFGSRLIWTGAAGGTLWLQENLWNGILKDVDFSGNFLCDYVMISNCPQGGFYENVTLHHGRVGSGAAFLLRTNGQSSCVFNTFTNLRIHDTNQFGMEMAGDISGATVLRAVTLNTFINCRFAAGVAAIRLTQAADTNTWIGGRVEAPGNGHGIILNTSAVNSGVFSNYFYGVPIDASVATSVGISYSNNAYQNVFNNCPFALAGGTNYVAGTGGKLKLVDCLRGGTPDNEYESVGTIGVGASPFNYVNTNPFAVEISVFGGTVSQIRFGRNGVNTSLSATSGSFWLEPRDSLEVTYTVAPSMLQIPH